MQSVLDGGKKKTPSSYRRRTDEEVKIAYLFTRFDTLHGEIDRVTTFLTRLKGRMTEEEEGRMQLEFTRLLETLKALSKEFPPMDTLPKEFTALQAKNKELAKESRALRQEILKAHERKEDDRLTQLNTEITERLWLRSWIELELAYSFFTDKKNPTAALALLIGVRNRMSDLKTEYWWRRVRKVIGQKITHEMLEDWFKIPVEVTYVGDYDIRLSEKGEVTIYRRHWRKRTIPTAGGEMVSVNEPEVTAFKFQDMPTALRSEIHIVVSQGEAYREILRALSNLQHLLLRMKQQKEKREAMPKKELRAALEITYAWAHRGIASDLRRRALPDLENGAAYLEKELYEDAMAALERAKGKLRQALERQEKTGEKTHTKALVFLNEWRKFLEKREKLVAGLQEAIVHLEAKKPLEAFQGLPTLREKVFPTKPRLLTLQEVYNRFNQTLKLLRIASELLVKKERTKKETHQIYALAGAAKKNLKLMLDDLGVAKKEENARDGAERTLERLLFHLKAFYRLTRGATATKETPPRKMVIDFLEHVYFSMEKGDVSEVGFEETGKDYRPQGTVKVFLVSLPEEDQHVQRFRRNVVDIEDGIQAIHFQDADGGWVIVMLSDAFEKDEQGRHIILLQQLREIVLREQGKSWQQAHEQAVAEFHLGKAIVGVSATRAEEGSVLRQNGTGVIVGEDSESLFVLTADHNVEDMNETEVFVPQPKGFGELQKPLIIQAEAFGRDQDNDLAILKISNSNIPSEITLHRVTLANPKDVQTTTSYATIASLNYPEVRKRNNEYYTAQKITHRPITFHLDSGELDWFPTTYPLLHKGASGSPVVDEHGYLIGIVKIAQEIPIVITEETVATHKGGAIPIQTILNFLERHKVPGLKINLKAPPSDLELQPEAIGAAFKNRDETPSARDGGDRQQTAQGILVGLVGPSAGGRTTMMRKLEEEFPGVVEQVILYTTRTPRSGETNGIDHYFVSNEEFDRRVKADGLVRVESIYGARYGIPRHILEQKLTEGKILLVSMSGKDPELEATLGKRLIYIHISPVSENQFQDQEIIQKELLARHTQRGISKDERVEERLENAVKILGKIQTDESVVYNLKGQPNEAYEQLKGILSKMLPNFPPPNPTAEHTARDGGVRVTQDSKKRERLEKFVMSFWHDDFKRDLALFGNVQRVGQYALNRKKEGEPPSDRDFEEFKKRVGTLMGGMIGERMSLPPHDFTPSDLDDIYVAFLLLIQSMMRQDKAYLLALEITPNFTEGEIRKLALLEMDLSKIAPGMVHTIHLEVRDNETGEALQKLEGFITLFGTSLEESEKNTAPLYVFQIAADRLRSHFGEKFSASDGGARVSPSTPQPFLRKLRPEPVLASP